MTILRNQRHQRSIKQPDENEFLQVKQLVEDFWLDNMDMKPEQFFILSENGKVIAFGRLRKYDDATELCTLGIAKEFRGKGYGSALVLHLLKQANTEVFAVTVIPDFFLKFGFKIVSEYPQSIENKCKLCAEAYHTGEKYEVMRWIKPQN
jgi:N-acetylglutamate synthase-like GNAT family acetyltransferase